MKKILILAAAAVLLAAAVSAGEGPRDVRLPEYSEHTLDNGLKVFIVETREIPMFTMRLLIPAGSSSDERGMEGVADLTATMLMKGAGGMGADEIADAIDGVGGFIGTGSGIDASQVSADFMSRDLALALELMATVVTSPDFPGDEFERARGIVKAKLLSDRESPSRVASRAFVRELLGEHPYANPVEGYAGSMERITRDDIAGFHGTHYVPEGCILAIVGDVDAKKTLKMVKKEFGKWKGKRMAGAGVPEVAAADFKGTRVIVIDKPDVTQSQIRIGNIGTGRDTPDFFPIEVANSMLGGGFTSRLMDEIRVNRGLSYGARSRMAQYLRGGYFGVYTYTKNATLRETIDVALGELEKMREVEVSGEELKGTQTYISGLFPFELETNTDLARWLIDLEFYGLGKDFVENYRSGIHGVTSGDVQRIAREHFHSKDNLIVLLTNYEETATQLEGLGEITVIKMDDVP